MYIPSRRYDNPKTPCNAAKSTESLYIPSFIPSLTMTSHCVLPALLFTLALGAVAGWTGASGGLTSEKSSWLTAFNVNVTTMHQ
jgi:hypothetical protein